MGPSALLPSCHSLQCRLHSAQQRPCRASRLVVHATGSTFGTLFRVSTFGESHGKGVGCVVDGVPPRLPISKEEIQAELDRRRPGQSRITTPRKESDTCEIYSGAPGAALLKPCSGNGSQATLYHRVHNKCFWSYPQLCLAGTTSKVL